MRSSALVLAIALLLVPALARAESHAAEQVGVGSSYAGFGVDFIDQRAGKLGVFGDAGARLGGSPVFTHARVELGLSGNAGDYEQLRVGVEARACVTRAWVCAAAGVDGGVQRDHLVDWTPSVPAAVYGDPQPVDRFDAIDALVVPRIAVESTTRFRARVALETPLFQQLGGSERSHAVAFSFGGAYAF